MRGQAAIQARHVKVEDVIFDGPVCRTCRDMGGDAISYPCDAATLLTRLERAERVAAAAEELYRQAQERTGNPTPVDVEDVLRKPLTAWQEARDAH